MRKVLALDLATNVGFAVGIPGGEPAFGSHRLPATQEDVGGYAVKFDYWLRAVLREHAPVTTIVFCATILPNHVKANIATIRKLNGLAWHTEFTAKRFELECFEMYEAQAKKTFVGAGNAKKPDVEARCLALGWQVQNQDESDALCAWVHACAQLAPKAGARWAATPTTWAELKTGAAA